MSGVRGALLINFEAEAKQGIRKGKQKVKELNNIFIIMYIFFRSMNIGNTIHLEYMFCTSRIKIRNDKTAIFCLAQ